MASFDSHVDQSKSNLRFLSHINKIQGDFWDWQVTTCFYIAVHVVNSHIAKVSNLHYNTHEAVKQVLNPFSLSPCKIPQEIYLDYVKLEGLSRRSRYLCNEEKKTEAEKAHITYDKHFAKSVKCLDRILSYFSTLYKIQWDKCELKCIELNKTPLKSFSIKM